VAAELPAPAQAPLWGLARVIGLEHPELRCASVDIDLAAEDALLAEVWVAPGDDRVALRGSERFVPRLVPLAEPEVELPTGPAQLVCAAPGLLESLELRPVARRIPAAGEIEIAVLAAGLNFRDVLTALGVDTGQAGTPGGECVGRVVALGEGVDLPLGTLVMALAAGSFGSFVITLAALATPLPPGLSVAEAATLPVAFLTARYALHEVAHLAPGQRVLIHAATGGVGLAALQVARRAGAEIFATAGSPAKRALLHALGVHHIFDSRSTDFAPAIRELVGAAGIDVVLNSLAGDFIPAGLALLRPGGHFLELGKTELWNATAVAAVNSAARYTVVDLGQVSVDAPDLVQQMLRELAQDVAAGALQPLPYALFPVARAVSAYRYMAQARHIGKLVLTFGDPPTLRPDATYLITGGLGALGLAFARELVAQGARHLALVGRRPPTPEAAAVLQDLEASGAQVAVFQADVAQGADVARVLAAIDATMPPLRGIVHAAGVIDDGVLMQQTWARVESVLAPKVAGAWHLHQQTLRRPLDFFALCSSMAALFGAAGQSGYAAANAFLDALAHYRRGLGLPATSINWGPWAAAGMAATVDGRNRARWAEQGIGEIAPQDGARDLLEIVGRGLPQVAVLPINWRAYLGEAAPPAFLAALAPAAAPIRNEPGLPLAQRLAAAVPGDRKPMLIDQVAEQARRVLGLPVAAALDLRRPLQELGLDSLMAIELRNRLGQIAGQSLPASLLFDCPTIAAVADFLAQQVFATLLEEGPPLVLPAPSVPASDPDQLSEQEVDALLAGFANRLGVKGA
jgi:NADPH:quinone reductase-like Zn-dependent oxidoreductase/short-subunit dehydrogenase/acyl carrier protein